MTNPHPAPEELITHASQVMARKACMQCGTEPAGGTVAAVHEGKVLVAPLCETCTQDPQAREQAGAKIAARLLGYAEAKAKRDQALSN